MGRIGEIFTDWVHKALPDRAEKILHQIEDIHGGTLNSSEFGKRMRGEGKIAEQVALQFKLARKKFMPNVCLPPLDYSHFTNDYNRQTTLF